MATTSVTDIRQEILSGLEKSIGQIPRTKEYRLGMIGALLVLLTLFVFYISILTVLFWVLINLIGVLVTFGGQQFLGILRMPIYGFAFILVGSIFLALLKPLLILRTGPRRRFQLHRKQEPFLFDFVDGVCRAVGAKPPRRVFVMAETNAAASLSSGPLDNETDLIIGMPLFHGLNTRQLAGVLAHEFGHFAQSDGMKLTSLVHALMSWFHDAVFERDWMDLKIRQWSENGNGFWRMIFWVVRRAIGFSRIGIYGLLLVAQFFLARLMQQMEFDADRYEARLAGSQSFAQNSRQMLRLSFGEHQAVDELDYYRKVNQLPDDWPAFVADTAKGIKEDDFKEIEEKRLSDTTSWSDSHPCDRDRIENAVRENAPGLFTVEYPATQLLSNIDALGRAVTLEFFREAFGSEFKVTELNDTKKLLKSRESVRSDRQAALRFVFEQFSLYDTIILPRPYLGKAMDNEQYVRDTEQRRSQLLNHAGGFAKLVQQEEKTWIELSKAIGGKTLMEAGFNLSSAGDTFNVRTIPEANHKYTELSAKTQQLHSQLRKFRTMIGERLLDALEYMRSEEVAVEAGEAANVGDEINSILKIWTTIASQRDALETFYLDGRVAQILIRYSEDQLDDHTLRILQGIISRINDFLLQLQRSTLSLTYPFEHGLGKVSVAHFLIPTLPMTGGIAETMNVATELTENLDYLLRRILIRLSGLAEKVETVFGFEPMETPGEITGQAKASLVTTN